MKWDKKFGEEALDRDALRAQYLGDVRAGKGSKDNLLITANGRASPLSPELANRDLPALPDTEPESANTKRTDSRSPARIATKISPPVEASSATRVPWPNDSPTHTSLPAPEEKSFVPTEAVDQHPALRKPVPERKPIVALQSDVRASDDQTHVPEKKSPPNKLKKKEGGGFRKLFGRKKTDTPAPASVEPMHAMDHEKDAYMQAPDAIRSTSRLEDHEVPIREPSPAYSTEQPAPFRAPSPRFERSPAASSAMLADSRRPSPPVMPGSAAHEQREADQAFSQFDQGPIDDMPAFVPDDSDDEGY